MNCSSSTINAGRVTEAQKLQKHCLNAIVATALLPTSSLRRR